MENLPPDFPTHDFDVSAFKTFWEVSHPEALHVARNWSKADVSRLEWPPASGNWVVIKDMSARPLWFRLLAGRYFLKRESRALRALDGVAGVPAFMELLNPDCLVMEWKAGTPALDFARGQISPLALENLSRLLREVHERGVTHGDLHRDNVLISENDEVSIIDWATASIFAPGKRKWTWREWAALDSRAVAKIKLRHAPQLLEKDEREILLKGSTLYRAIRNLGHWFRRLRGAHVKRSPAESAQRYERQIEQADLSGEKPREHP